MRCSRLASAALILASLSTSRGQSTPQAFDVVAAQVEGPEWLDAGRYDLTAKADTSKEIAPDELRPMLRKLLVERFALKYHTETKSLPVYSLGVMKSGVKFSANTGERGPMTDFRSQSGKLTIVAKQAIHGANRGTSGEASRPQGFG